MSVRYNRLPALRSSKRAFHPLDLLPIDARDICSRIIIDACIPYEWERKPIEIFLDKDMADKVRAKWKEYGFEG